MSNTTVFKSSSACTDTSLPILYKDPAISASTLFCYDLLDVYTWASQAAPSGAGTLIDLAGVANASISATAIGWGGAGGFVFDNADADNINLPTSTKLASNVAGFGIAWWIKPATVSGSSQGISGIGSGYNYATDQFSVHRDTSNLVVYANGLQAGSNISIAAGSVYQIGVTIELSGGSLLCKAWKNGVQAGSTTTRPSTMVQPSNSYAVIGSLPLIFGGNGDSFTLYRCHADALSSRTGAEFIAADYAAGVGRFS